MARRRLPSFFLFASGLATCWLPTSAMGQTYDPTLAPAPISSDQACGMGGCQPRATSYGYYLENWRRWPEEPALEAITPRLSPFSIPPRPIAAPAAEVPDARDETSGRQRRPASPSTNGSMSGSRASSAPPTRTTPPPAPSTSSPAPPVRPNTAPPALTPDSELPDAELPDSELPDSELPNADGFSSDELPDGTDSPSTDESDSPFFPATPESGSQEPLPDLGPDIESDLESTDELLDGLPDLDSRRLQRYQNQRTGNYRRADEGRSVSQARPKTKRPQRAVATAKPAARPKASQRSVAASPVAYRSGISGRRNPLRANEAAAPVAHAPRVARQKPQDVVPVEFIEDEETLETFDEGQEVYEDESIENTDDLASDVSFSEAADEEAAPASTGRRTSGGRSNPLRNRSL